MFEQSWQIALVLGTVLLYVFLLIQFARTQLSGEKSSGVTTREQAEGEHVVCPECGTANEPGYRYCRSCVTELPRSVDFDGKDSHPLVRGTR